MKAREKFIQRIRSKTINTVDVSPEGRNHLVKSVLRYRSEEIPDSRRALAQLKQTLTLGDAMDAAEGNGYAIGYLQDALTDLGLTHLDWRLLKPETATDQISGLKKTELSSLDVRVLQAFSHKALHNIWHYVFGQPWIEGRGLPVITIGELVAKVSYPQIFNQHFGSFEASFLRAFDLLRDLGFGYADGLFFQEGTKRKLVADFASKHQLGTRTAKKFVAIILKEGWLKAPLGE